MNRMLAGLGVVGVLVLGPSSLQAAPLPTGGVTAGEVAKALLDKGYKAEVTTDSAGDPMIRSSADGSNFRILFYSCKNSGPRCVSITFSAGFDLDKGLSYSRINEWNSEKRFGRAYLDDEMDPYVQMDVDFERGATNEAISNVVDTWAAVLPVFKSFINDR